MHNYTGKISILMPAYNEGHHIYSNILETYKIFNEMGCRYEIIVIDDGSADNTKLEAQKAAKKFGNGNIFIKENSSNYGKGWTLKNGFEAASGDLVIFLDADLDLHPKQLKILFTIMQKNNADIVIGCKRHPLSVIDYPLSRRAISGVYFF